MSDSPATSSTDPSAPPETNRPAYMNFRFFKLNSSYRHLMANEKVVARQEFLSTYDSLQDRMPIAAYALTGLRSDCDMLIWRVTPHLKDLHAMSTRLQSSGLGKYLDPVLSLTGTVPGRDYRMPTGRKGASQPPPNPIGAAPYIVVQTVLDKEPVTPALARSFSGGELHIADSTGLDDPAWILACETNDPLKYRAWVTKQLTGARTGRTFVGLRGPMREIVDSFG